jgi:hypothetical protein
LPSLFDAIDCSNDGDVCASWCEASPLLGCPTNNCDTPCSTRVADETCGYYYADVLECGMRFGAVDEEAMP